MTVPSAACTARQRFDDAIGVLRRERNLGGEASGRRDAHRAGDEADLARDENAFVYLDGWVIG